jgi:predicted nuclease of predicted toxin-antitoxin system
MKLLLDQNLSYKLIPLLLAAFPGSKHVRDFSLTRAWLALLSQAGRM